MLKWALLAAAVLLALALAAIAAVPWLVDTAAMHAYIGQLATHALGRPVKYASLSVSALPLPAVKLKQLEVADDPAFGSAPVLTVGEGRIRIRLRPLLSGRVELDDLVLDEPRLSLIEDAQGRLNVTSLVPPIGHGPARGSAGRQGGAPASAATLFSNVRIVNGSLRYSKIGGRDAAVALEKINVVVTHAAPRQPLQARGDAVAQPGDVRLLLRDVSLVLGGSRSPADMPLTATVDVEATDIAPIAALFGTPLAVGGSMKGRLDVTGTLARVTAAGAMSFDRVTLSADRPHCGEPARRQLVVESVRLPLAVSPAGIESAPVTATVATGNLSLRATISLDGRTAALSGIGIKGMELRPVLVDFLCQPYALTGPLELSGDAGFRLDDAWKGVGGAGRLRVGRGQVVGREIVNLVREVLGLGSTVVGLIRPDRPIGESVLDFDSITASYTIAAGVARTDDLLYRARDVQVRGAGTYALADGRVAMEVRLSQGGNHVKAFVSGAPGSLRVVPMGARLEDTRDIRKFLDRLFR